MEKHPRRALGLPGVFFYKFRCDQASSTLARFRAITRMGISTM